MRSHLLAVLLGTFSCGGTQSEPVPRDELPVQPEGEEVCLHDGEPVLLSKWPGGLCGTNPARRVEGEELPSCRDSAARLGCR